MSWTDTLEMLTVGSSSVVLFCTATTGLHKTDKLLAVSYVMYDGDVKGKSDTLFLEAPDAILQPAMQYHQISPEIMHMKGMSLDTFREELSNALTGRIGFTYNASFQFRAMLEMDGGVFAAQPCVMCELPLWIKAAESRLTFTVDPIIEKAEHQIANMVAVPPWKRLLENRGISSRNPPGVLPVEYNAQCLSMLYEALIEEPPNIELALK